MVFFIYDWFFRERKKLVYFDKILKDNWRKIYEYMYKYLRVISGNWLYVIIYGEVEELIRMYIRDIFGVLIRISVWN